jgi:hypothetical protein
MLSSQGGVSTDIEQSYTASVLNAAKVSLVVNDLLLKPKHYSD